MYEVTAYSDFDAKDTCRTFDSLDMAKGYASHMERAGYSLVQIFYRSDTPFED